MGEPIGVQQQQLPPKQTMQPVNEMKRIYFDFILLVFCL
jgi:hypothetical protein